MSIVFMGTPTDVLPVLGSLQEAGYPVAGVYTQPDQPIGRGRVREAPPVKKYALLQDLAVYQPSSWRSPKTIQQVALLQPDVIVVAAYGKLLPPEVLRLSKHGCLNLHPSLLPRHRGPSPVITTILEGDSITGVTLMLVDEGMDTGPILAQRTLSVEDHDTGGSLTRQLFEIGAHLVVETLPVWLAGKLQPVPQNQHQASVTKRITKEDGRLDWRQPAAQLCRQVRALDPWPGTYTRWQGKFLKVAGASLPEIRAAGPPGKVHLLNEGREPRLGVVAGDGSLLGVSRLQLEGRRSLGVGEFLRGQPSFIGSQLPS